MGELDEQKRLEYLASERRREAFQLQQERKLTPPPGPAIQTRKNWQPVIDYLNEEGRSCD
jgi:hypothetical protein